MTVLSPEARAARNAYRRAWAKANPDKVSAMQQRYWAKKAEQAAAKEVATDDK